jgi:hypothetical protein
MVTECNLFQVKTNLFSFLFPIITLLTSALEIKLFILKKLIQKLIIFCSDSCQLNIKHCFKFNDETTVWWKIFCYFSDIYIHSVNFKFLFSLVSHLSTDTWGQFYQHSTSSFYEHRYLKCKKTVKMSIFFALLGSALLKSASRMLMKLTLGQWFFEIQQRYVDKKFKNMCVKIVFVTRVLSSLSV